MQLKKTIGATKDMNISIICLIDLCNKWNDKENRNNLEIPDHFNKMKKKTVQFLEC